MPAIRSSTWASTPAPSSRRWSADISDSGSTGTWVSRPPASAWSSASCSTSLGGSIWATPASTRQPGSRRRPWPSRSGRPRAGRVWASAALVLFGLGVYTGVIPITPTQIADAAGYMLLGLSVGFFGWVFLVRRLDARRAQSSAADRRALRRGRALWSVFEQAGSTLNLFADRNTEQLDLRLEFSEQLVPVGQSRSSSSPSRRCSPGCGSGWPARQGARSAVQVRHRAPARGRRIRRADSAGRRGAGGHAGRARLAAPHLPAAHLGRTGSEPGRPERDDQARAGAHRRPGDGRLVPRHVGRATSSAAARRGFYESMSLPNLFTAVAAFALIAGFLFLVFSRPLNKTEPRHRIAAVRHGTRGIHARSATSTRRPSRPARSSSAPATASASSACRSISPATCTTTSGSSTTACCCHGRCRRARRSIPKTKRLAMHVEDHPLDYGEFEGVIPEGYGAGIVMLWDRGTWTPEVDDVDAALKKGDLKFTLNGYKLKGSWVLVRTSGRYPARARSSRGGDAPQLAADQASRRLGRRARHHRVRAAEREERRRFRRHPRRRHARRLAVEPARQGRRGRAPCWRRSSSGRRS